MILGPVDPRLDLVVKPGDVAYASNGPGISPDR